MKLTSPSEVRALLRELGVAPRRRLGQSFLIDRNVLDIIVDAADLGPEDGVLEIGAGLGVLTERLVEKAGRVAAVEIDGKLHGYLRERFSGARNLELLRMDALTLDYGSLFGSGLNKLVANLPYSTGSRMLVDMVRAPVRPQRVVVTVQLEVADRLGSEPGKAAYGALSVWMQAAYSVAVRKRVSPTCFWPVPEVRSAIVVMERRDDASSRAGADPRFFPLTKHAFMHRRKQMATVLSRDLGGMRMPPGSADDLLRDMGIDPRSRPEDIGVREWIALAQRIPWVGKGIDTVE